MLKRLSMPLVPTSLSNGNDAGSTPIRSLDLSVRFAADTSENDEILIHASRLPNLKLPGMDDAFRKLDGVNND